MKKIFPYAAILIAVALFFVAGPAVFLSQPPPVVQESVDIQKTQVPLPYAYSTGCVIRWSSTGVPYAYVNETHSNTANCHNLSVESDGDLSIDHDGGSISTIICNPDETLARDNIICGGSGGVYNTIIRFQDAHNDVEVAGNSTRLRCGVCNVWVGFIKQGALR